MSDLIDTALARKLRDAAFSTPRELLIEAADRIDQLTAERDALAERVRDLEGVIDTALSVASAAPEINPSNYDHDQVCDLNGAAVEVYSILYNARKEQP